MSVTVTRNNSDLLGTQASPASIAASGNSTSTALDMTVTGVIKGVIAMHLIVGGSAPTSAITIQWYFSLDGTNYIEDGSDISLTVQASTNYDFRYEPPDAAKKAQVKVTNGATNGITLWVSGNTLALS